MSKWIVWLLIFCGLIASASAQTESAPTKNFNRFNFTAGGVLGIGKDDVASYVGNSPQATFGAGMNYSRLVGFDAEYMYYDLGFRSNVIKDQALPGQSGHMQSFSLDAIVTVPKHLWTIGAYGIFGVGFYDRSVKLAHPQFLANGTPMQPAWRWWDLNWVDNNPAAGPVIQQPGPPGPPFGETMSSNSKIAGGFNFGGGVTYPLNRLKNAKLFVEFRYHRAYQSDGQTIVMPITVGLRW
ncbi:MAG: outer membrane beta-barrel protein [Terriglobales bacterium]